MEVDNKFRERDTGTEYLEKATWGDKDKTLKSCLEEVRLLRFPCISNKYLN